MPKPVPHQHSDLLADGRRFGGRLLVCTYYCLSGRQPMSMPGLPAPQLKVVFWLNSTKLLPAQYFYWWYCSRPGCFVALFGCASSNGIKSVTKLLSKIYFLPFANSFWLSRLCLTAGRTSGGLSFRIAGGTMGAAAIVLGTVVWICPGTFAQSCAGRQ